MKCRVEHFHPKSDQDPACNWAPAWGNLLVVCNGGSHPHVATPGYCLEPTTDNLSCDAHKDRMIQQAGWDTDVALGKLATQHFRPEWPAFFSTLRTSQRPAAEAQLRSLGFQG